MYAKRVAGLTRDEVEMDVIHDLTGFAAIVLQQVESRSAGRCEHGTGQAWQVPGNRGQNRWRRVDEGRDRKSVV